MPDNSAVVVTWEGEMATGMEHGEMEMRSGERGKVGRGKQGVGRENGLVDVV